MDSVLVMQIRLENESRWIGVWVVVGEDWGGGGGTQEECRWRRRRDSKARGRKGEVAAGLQAIAVGVRVRLGLC